MVTSLEASNDVIGSRAAAGARILLIDPNPQSRASYRVMLRELGVAVDAVARAQAAVARAARLRPDLVLLRISLDRGWDAAGLESLRAHPDTRDIPVVVLACDVDTATVVAALDRGARDVWACPLSAAELAARVRAHMRTVNEMQRLREQISVDELTGILNRRGILSALERETNRLSRDGTPMGILLIDVDDFKRINDTHGHSVGDHVLRDIGRVLAQSIRSTDAAGRLGGDEFLVVLADVDEAQAQQVAARIRADIERIAVGESGMNASASIGIAVTHAPHASSNGLLDDADRSMYREKRSSEAHRPHARA